MEVDEQGGLGGQGTSAIVSERSGGAPAVGDGGSTAGNGERERERERERDLGELGQGERAPWLGFYRRREGRREVAGVFKAINGGR
jgi:hypothetical protein